MEILEVLVCSSFRQPFLMDIGVLHFDHSVNDSDLTFQTFLEDSHIIWSKMNTFNDQMFVCLFIFNPVLNDGRQMLMDQVTLLQVIL